MVPGFVAQYRNKEKNSQHNARVSVSLYSIKDRSLLMLEKAPEMGICFPHKGLISFVLFFFLPPIYVTYRSPT